MDNRDFTGNIERFSGFADVYDHYRPAPPVALAEALARWANLSHPHEVVDLGSGTGLSTRYWADKAEQVIGVEPTADMRQQAEAQTPAGNIRYREGFSHQTGLSAHEADVVMCAQSLHWMEPLATFREAARILRPGGVFVATDYDWPPTTSAWEADAAYEACMSRVQELGKQHVMAHPLQQWDKAQHLSRMRDSGCFRYVKEIVLHHVDAGNAERLVGLLLSQGGVMMLLKAGLREEQLGIDAFRAVAVRTLGEIPLPWYWSARVRIGVC